MIPWIISQVKKTLGKPENAVYTKFKAVLKQQDTINMYTHIYYLGGFEYTEENYDNYKKTGAASLRNFLSAVEYNVLADNVEILH